MAWIVAGAIAAGVLLLTVAVYVVEGPWSVLLTGIGVLGPICFVGFWDYRRRRTSR
jgi:hypothetical protein